MTLFDGRMINTGYCYLKALAGFIVHSTRALGWPISAALEPSNICNLTCPLCATGSNSLTRPKGCMNFDDFKRIVANLPSSVKNLYLWGQGEPFMAPDFLSMVRYASSQGLKTIVSTNGHFLGDPEEIVKSGLDVLIVSLDGVDSETYTSYRKDGDFNRVITGIQRAAEMVQKEGYGPVIELQFLVTRKNTGDIDKFKSFAHSLGANRVVFKTIQAISMENGVSYLPDNMKHTRYRKNAEGLLETDRLWFLKNRCLRLYYSFQVDWEGNVLPCCFDKDSTYSMGNLLRDPFRLIWNSAQYRSFRDMLNRQGRVLPMCRDCTEGLKGMNLHV